MDFEYTEDRKYFADIFCNGDILKLERGYKEFFDFRPNKVKRVEFNKLKPKLFKSLIKSRGDCCELSLVSGCTRNKNLVIDHFVPLSTNKLNKEIRKMKPGNGRKVVSQSFGSNNLCNLRIACGKCNGFKKHKILAQKG